MATFVPKYAPQASQFNEMITGNNESLISSGEQLKSISGEISIDPQEEDALAFNTLIMIKSASQAIEEKVESNVNLGDAITSAAKKFDEEDYEEFQEAERQRALAEARAKKAKEEEEAKKELSNNSNKPVALTK